MINAPTVLFALLNPLVFLLPVESGECVSLANVDGNSLILLDYKEMRDSNVHSAKPMP
jgi:hypothetical protein